MLRLTVIALVLTAGAVSAAPRPSHAAPSPTSHEVALQGLRSAPTGDAARQIALTRGSSWRNFEARHGRWSVQWNEATGTPHRAFGQGIPLTGFAPDPEAVDRAVRRFVAANPALFGAVPGLERVACEPAGNV